MDGTALPRGIRVGLTLAIALVLLAASGILALNRGFLKGQEPLPVLTQMPAFHLVDQAGQPLSADDLKGQVLLVGFIYTSCPDICPAITAQMRSLQDRLARTGLQEQVKLLSISVDPEQDTPDRLADYARRFEADTGTWRFLTGDPAHVRAVVVDGFLLGMERQTVPTAAQGHGSHGDGAGQAGGAPRAPDYRVEHSGRVALVDREGRVRAYHDGNALDHDLLLAQVRQLAAGR